MGRDEKREWMYSLVEQWETSGLSRRAFAREHGLSDSILKYWHKHRRASLSATTDTTSLSETVEGSINRRAFVPLVEEITSLHGSGDHIVVITLASGTRIEVR